MKQTFIEPSGWPCTLEEADPGPFIVEEHPDMLCFKSEYHHDDGRVMSFNGAGEFATFKNVDVVQPVKMVLIEWDV